MAPQTPVVFVLGPPGAGKSTLGKLLTEKFPVQHLSVGDLLRRIKNDDTHPQAEGITSSLRKQELIDANILVPILRSELDHLRASEQAKAVILVDGFPRNVAQLRGFEEASGAPLLVLLVGCPKDVAKQRYLKRKLKGRETDDEAMFEKRYGEYVQENEGIAREYLERGLLVKVDVSKGQQEALQELWSTLKEDRRWNDAVYP